MKDLLEIREEIDRIDGQMIELYEKRMECTAQVAEYNIRFRPERRFLIKSGSRQN